jgi:ferredoxin-thioredoxin reductase catalytic subunit
MSAAEVMAPADAAPADVAEAPAVDPLAAPVDEDEDEDEELVFKARGKRVRAAADVKAGDAGEDTSPRGPIDASQADSPPKSSDDEAGDDEAGLPGKKRLKLRTKGAAEAAKAAGFARQEGDSELEDEGAPEEEEEDAFYGYAEDDEEAALEMRLREKGTLSDDEADEDVADGADEESEESDLDDSEDDFELDDFDARDARAPSKRGKKASFAPAARAPPPENETEQEKEARMAQEKAETAATQQEIMREASRRARLSGYHVAPDRDPFAYRKIFAHVAARVERLGLPAPPPEAAFAEEEDDKAYVARESGDEEDDFDADDFDADDDAEADAEADAEVVELEVDADEAEEDALIDDLDDLDGVAAVVAAVRAKKASGELHVSPEAAAAELAAQKAKEAAAAAEDAAAPAEEDDLSEEETREMTRKERLKQLKKAKAFFKADADARRKTRAGEAFEDEAEMSDDGGHTSDEEEVEVEERTGADGRVIKRRATKRADGLLDREELEEMVDYIDFDDAADDDERRAQKRAAAHARFEEERDDEELRRMKEALENGFRRKEKGGALDGGPEGWQRRRRAQGEDSDDDDLGIDVPDRAWEAVELSSDDDGEWAERAARRKAAAAAAEAAAAEAPRAAGGDSLSARDVGFDSQDFRIMIDAGKKGRRARTRRGVDAAVAALDHANGFPAPVRSTAGGLPRANSANVAGAAAATGPGLERHSSTSFLGRGNGSRSGAGASGAGLVRSASLGGGGASRSFVFGASGDSQSMWDKDAEERSAAERPATTLREIGGDENARADFGWAPRERMAAPASKPKGSRLGNGGGSQSLFGMLEASQDWDEVLGKGDSLARGVKAAKNVRLRAVPR